MSLYPESRFPVRDEITLVHTSQLRNISSPGTWFSGQERRAIAVAARNAGVAAGLIERPEISESEDSPVPAHIQKVVATIAANVHALKQSFYEQALADGLTDSEYVEIVGVVSRLVDLDVFARGIGVTPRSLPEAASGQPTRERPQTAVVEQAWVPTIPNGPEGGEVGAGLYHGQPMPYIVRSLSLVPEELRAHVELETAHYTRLDKLFDYQYQHHDGLTRPQAELVAGRVSALNDCFYWTLYHARFLRESGRQQQLEVNPEALVRPELDSGVPGGAELLEFAESVIGPDPGRLYRAREALETRMSRATVVGAAAIAGNFSRNDRIADATGIPIDPSDLEPTRAIRARLGLDQFKSAANTFRHYADT